MASFDNDSDGGQQKETQKVNDTIDEAWDFISRTAEQDPDADGSPWKNPAQVYQNLEEHRVKVFDALRKLRLVEEEHETRIDQQKYDEEEVKAAYIDMVVSAFDDQLDEFKKKGGEDDVDLLVDCLQSGLELWSRQDKDILVESQRESDGDGGDQEGWASVHQRRQEMLGLKLSE